MFIEKQFNLEPPCSYQGGKIRLAPRIVDIIVTENYVDKKTVFYDCCCGSGAISLELINRGVHPSNVVMIDKGLFGLFWNMVANEEFELDIFQQEVFKLPEAREIRDYLQDLSNKPIDEELKIYHYLLFQAGSFGGKQIWEQDGVWKNNSFRNYWEPTPTSKRRSPVNPMMPMPATLFKRVEDIMEHLHGTITAIHADVFSIVPLLEDVENTIVYIDPPYINTTGYKDEFDIYDLIKQINSTIPIYVSEGAELQGVTKTHLLSKGRAKGNISGERKKQPTQEWLNVFN